MARRVDATKIGQLNQLAQEQKLGGTKTFKTYDPKFPTFATPINKKILVYIPRVETVETETGVELNPLRTINHSVKINNFSSLKRCVNGLQFDELGYDGECPYCKALAEQWAWYKKSMETEAIRSGNDANSEPMKEYSKKLLTSFEIDKAEEYVTFPVVIVPIAEGKEAKLVPAQDWRETSVVQYITWTRKRYEEKLMSLVECDGTEDEDEVRTLVGSFILMDFTYDTKGAQANARDSAKNATYKILKAVKWNAAMQNAGVPAHLDDMAKEFTNDKASEVIVSNEYMYKEDMTKIVNKAMATKRQAMVFATESDMGEKTLPSSGLENFKLGEGKKEDLGVDDTDSDFNFDETKVKNQSDPDFETI